MEILLSIKPKYVKEIFNRTKRYEFRRAIFKNKKICDVIIYSTSPEKKIVGRFKIGKIIRKNPKELWDLFNKEAGIGESDFFKYFEGKEEGFAIEIVSVKEFENKIDPYKLIPGFKAPQFFSYFDTSLIHQDIESEPSANTLISYI